MKFLYKLTFLLSVTSLITKISFAQNSDIIDSTTKFKTISAGPQYKRSGWHNFFWGKNYRKEWSTPVTLPVFLLDSIKGGLVPVKEGGGHQTTSLHLENKDEKEYALRSVDKRLGKVLPQIFLGTFIEKLVNDEVSMSHPYSAAAIPGMAHSAGIYHTKPKYVYLAQQAALDTFAEKFGDKIYLFEQRVKGNWKDADNLGNFKEYFGTDEVMKKILDETENKADQAAFVKARLFDMFIADWDRHEDQWSWGMRKEGDFNVFVPVPIDRDQAFFKRNGLLLNAAIRGARIGYLQSLKGTISNVPELNYEERGLDRFFINELTKIQWQQIATELQQSLTDSVIESSVKKMPPPIFAISGEKIIAALKSRRNHLVEYATEYYLFLAKEVEIVGTKGTEYFNVKRINDKETEVKVFNINKKGVKEEQPYYSRIFLTSETKEVRLFGLSGNDVYATEGKVSNGIKIKIIGGDDKDSILANSVVNNNTKTYVYDGPEDYIESDGKIKTTLSDDSAIHKYQYRSYQYDFKRLSAKPFYSDADRIFIGLSYLWIHHKWRDLPFAFKQKISVNYSISQNAFNLTYTGIFPNAIGKWNLLLVGGYDFVNWINFYGLGNETVLINKDINYNRMRTKEGTAGIFFNKRIRHSLFNIGGFYRSVKIINDNERYVSKNIAPIDTTVFETKYFAGATAVYVFSKLNSSIVPTRGFSVSAGVSYTQNVNESSNSFWKYGGNFQLYLPLISKFYLAISGGIQSVTGDPEFYQYPNIGAGQTIRGFRYQRFYGKTAFYNCNEFRFLSDVRSYIFNGKAGLLAFVDDGRVWMPEEKSDILHVGYGGGILLAPFNFLLADITYGFSNEDRIFQLRFNLPF